MQMQMQAHTQAQAQPHQQQHQHQLQQHQLQLQQHQQQQHQQPPTKPLLWPQRLALLRHNLHIAHHTRDFSFFRALQVQTLLAGEDHVAALARQLEPFACDATDAGGSYYRLTGTGRNSSITSIGSNASSSNGTSLDADTVVANLDKLTTVIANVHEDAFTALADHVRAAVPATTVNSLTDTDSRDATPRIFAADYDAIRISARKEAIRQRAVAAASVDKMLDAATLLISQLPQPAQHEAVAVLTLGLAFVADALAVALAQMDRVEHCTFDPGRVDAAAESVGRVVSETVLALKGMFGLMDGSSESSQQPALRPTLGDDWNHHHQFNQFQQQQQQQQHRRHKSMAEQQQPPPSPGLARSWVRRISSALSVGSVESPAAMPLSGTPAPLGSPVAWDGLRQHQTQHHQQQQQQNQPNRGSTHPQRMRLQRVESADEDVAPNEDVGVKLEGLPESTQQQQQSHDTDVSNDNTNSSANRAAVDSNAAAPRIFDASSAVVSTATAPISAAPSPTTVPADKASTSAAAAAARQHNDGSSMTEIAPMPEVHAT